MGHITNAAAQAACNAVVDLIDVGGAGQIVFYSGSVPADADTALSGQTVLAELSLSATAFGAAADASPGATATAATITDDSSANASGTPTFARVFSGGGTAVMQLTVGGSGSGEDIEITPSTITSGQPVSVTSLTFTVPEAVT